MASDIKLCPGYLECVRCNSRINFYGKTVASAFSAVTQNNAIRAGLYIPQAVQGLLCEHHLILYDSSSRVFSGVPRKIWDSDDPSVYAQFEFNQRIDRIDGILRDAERLQRGIDWKREANLKYLEGKLKELEEVSAKLKSMFPTPPTEEWRAYQLYEGLAVIMNNAKRQSRTAWKNEQKFARDEKRIRLLRLAMKVNAVEWRPLDLEAVKPALRRYAHWPATVYDVTTVRCVLSVNDDLVKVKCDEVRILPGATEP